MGYALALSGGGLLGAAHLGVLDVLVGHGLWPAAVAGTSAGGLVASMLALSVPVADLIAFGDEVSKAPLRYFRINAVGVLEQLVPGHAPLTGLVNPEPFIAGLLGLAPWAAALDDWKMPAALTAVDVANQVAVAFTNGMASPARGQWVECRSQLLAVAMQATMAMPGLFMAPVADGRLLVDGGVADTLPVDWARALGPGPVLSVDVTQATRLPAVAMGLGEMLSASQQYATDTLSRLRDGGREGFLVAPETHGVPFFGFGDYQLLVQRGRDAMTKALPRFESYLRQHGGDS
jgi:NTE family protein